MPLLKRLMKFDQKVRIFFRENITVSATKFSKRSLQKDIKKFDYFLYNLTLKQRLSA